MADESKKPDAAAPPVGQAQTQQPVQVQVNDSNTLATYANFCRVTGSPEELIVDFGLNPQPIGVPKMLRMYCLQQWYGLADEALEEPHRRHEYRDAHVQWCREFTRSTTDEHDGVRTSIGGEIGEFELEESIGEGAKWPVDAQQTIRHDPVMLVR